MATKTKLTKRSVKYNSLKTLNSVAFLVHFRFDHDVLLLGCCLLFAHGY